ESPYGHCHYTAFPVQPPLSGEAQTPNAPLPTARLSYTGRVSTFLLGPRGSRLLGPFLMQRPVCPHWRRRPLCSSLDASFYGLRPGLLAQALCWAQPRGHLGLPPKTPPSCVR